MVGNQLLSHDQLKEKLKDDHLNRMVELSRLEELIDKMLKKFLVSPTKATTRLQESMVYIQFRLKQSMAWNMDLEVEAKLLCTLTVKEIHEKLDNGTITSKRRIKCQLKWIKST